MGESRFGVPIDLVRTLAGDLDIQLAIETGTWHGESAAELSLVFQKVWTIELDESLHRDAISAHQEKSNIAFLQGSSPAVLSRLLPEVEGPCLFWLDAHWGGSVGAGEDHQCPVLDEISAIDAWNHSASSCILIDDARWFLGPPDPKLRRTDWPTFLEVLDLLRARHDRYITIVDDVIVSGPPAAKGTLDEYSIRTQWKDLEQERYRLEYQVKAMEQELKDTLDPSTRTAARRLVKALLLPTLKRRHWRRHSVEDP